MPIDSGFSHEKWWFSIVMLVYQRIYPGFLHPTGRPPFFIWVNSMPGAFRQDRLHIQLGHLGENASRGSPTQKASTPKLLGK